MRLDLFEKDHAIMESNKTEDLVKVKTAFENKEQEFIGLLLSKPDNNKDVLQTVNYASVEKIFQEAQNSAVTVSLDGSSNLNICHVSLADGSMLLESDLIPHSLDGSSSVQLEDGCTLIQSYEAVDESDSSDAVTKFIDGQAVQLEDGTTAFIHASPREGLQPVQLVDGTMAYLSQAGGELFNGEASALDLDNIASSQISDCDGKEYGEKIGSSVGSSKTTEKGFSCPYEGCGRVYTTFHHLKVHERSHTGDRPFKCLFTGCEKGFATGYGLKSHTRIHTGETPYKCLKEFCKKAFKTSGDLQKHVRTHTGERPFKCPYSGCERAFTTSNIRKVHIRTHTGERPYICKEEGCGRAFASATNYKNHIRIHTGEKPYMCSFTGCNKRFTEYSSLYKHHVVHTHSKPYICDMCGRTYRQTSTLAAHKRTVHGIVEGSENTSNPDDDVEDTKEQKDLDESIKSIELRASPKVEKKAEVIDIKVPTKSASDENPSPEATSENKNNYPTVVTVQAENPSSVLHEQPVYAVQVQDDGTLSTTMQQYVIVTDPGQIAMLQQLAQQGQLGSVLSIADPNSKTKES